MHENTPETTLEWVPAVPGDIPDQAVIFGGQSENDAMYVAKVTDGSTTEGGLYKTNKQCAEYVKHNLFGTNEPKCIPTFEFLVLKQGECGATLLSAVMASLSSTPRTVLCCRLLWELHVPRARHSTQDLKA